MIFPESHERISFQLKKKKSAKNRPFSCSLPGTWTFSLGSWWQNSVDLGGSWLRHWILWLQELSIANMKETASYCLYKQSHSAKQQAQTYRLF